MDAVPDRSNARDDTERLRRAVRELTLLNELATAISATYDVSEIIELIVDRVAAAVEAEQVVLTLVDDRDLSPSGTLYRKPGGSGTPDFHLTRNLLGCMCHHQRPLLINDVAGDPLLRGIPLGEGVRNLICQPIMVGSRLIGCLSCVNRTGGGDFDDQDQRLTGIMANQSAQVLERARLVEEERRALQMQADLEVARQIQERLLPDEAPRIEGYDIAGFSIPAREVGGDYYDYIALGSDRFGLALGDISGKGIAAALLMSNLQATLRGQAPQAPTCRQFIHWCNQQIFLSTPANRFATLFYGVLDVGNHSLTYCNAGNEWPFYFSRDRECRRLREGGIPLGMMPDSAYRDDVIRLRPGDTLVAFTDGVTDTEDRQERPFGEDRLAGLLETLHEGSARGIAAGVKEALAAYAGDLEAFDDVTVMVVKRL